MLPFLNNKQKNAGISTGVIVKNRTPDNPEENQDDKDAAIHACANDLINSVHAKDIKGVAEAMRSAFEILEQMPHEEAEHTEPHSYESQKEE